MNKTVNVLIEQLKKVNEENENLKFRLSSVSGSLLLHDLFQVAAIENEDSMPVIKYIDKPNGESVAYVRYDAMVNKLNTLLGQ